MFKSGRHFLQLPGPTNVPDRILRALSRPTIDHRGPEFADLTRELLDGLRRVFRCDGPVFIYPSSASGAWEAALVNTLSPGDRVLAFDHGFFARKWQRVALRLGLEVEFRPGDWRRPVGPDAVASALSAAPYDAVLIVHNETSTGVRTDVEAVRRAMDAAGSDALLMVDAVSSLAAMEYRHDEWGVDVTVSGSQKGLMLPPGLAFVAAGAKALEAQRSAELSRSYWDWGDMLEYNERGFFPYTPATNLLYGLREALAMLEEEGLDRTFARHRRFAEATRRAVRGWGLETYCVDEAAHSDSGTTVLLPEGSNAEALRRLILERWDMSLGKGLGELEGRVFRIGHLGDLNALTLIGALGGVELGLDAAGIAFERGGVDAALRYLGEA